MGNFVVAFGRFAPACLALAACTTTTGYAGEEYVASFNEPFISFASEGATLLRTSPEDLRGTMLAAARERRGDRVRFTGLHAGRPFELTIIREPCADSMSGFAFSHTAVLVEGDAAPLEGCARFASEEQPHE